MNYDADKFSSIIVNFGYEQFNECYRYIFVNHYFLSTTIWQTYYVDIKLAKFMLSVYAFHVQMICYRTVISNSCRSRYLAVGVTASSFHSRKHRGNALSVFVKSPFARRPRHSRARWSQPVHVAKLPIGSLTHFLSTACTAAVIRCANNSKTICLSSDVTVNAENCSVSTY